MQLISPVILYGGAGVVAQLEDTGGIAFQPERVDGSCCPLRVIYDSCKNGKIRLYAPAYVQLSKGSARLGRRFLKGTPANNNLCQERIEIRPDFPFSTYHTIMSIGPAR